MVFFIYQAFEQEETKYHSHQAEERENELACSSIAEAHTKGHPLVLNKMQPEPIAQYIYLFTVIKIGFDIKLAELVGNDDEQYD